MSKFSYDLQNYTNEQLCDFFELDYSNFSGTELNKSYNKMITNVQSEFGITIKEKRELLEFLEKAFKKLLKEDLEYKLTEGNFMPKMTKNEIFSDENPVIKKEISADGNSVINPMKTKMITKLININTLFRKNYYGQKSSDFIIDLPETLKNVHSLTLINTEIPNNIYTFSSTTGTNEFTIETYETNSSGDNQEKETHVIRIKNGNYTPEELVSYLNKYIFSNDNALRRIACDYDKITKKIVFFRDTRATGSGGTPDETGPTKTYYFNLDWRLSENQNRSIQLNMGWLLGYRKEYYSYENDYIVKNKVSFDNNEGFLAEACYQHHAGLRYIFLSLDDYNKNFSKSLISPFEDSGINDDNIFAKINNNQNSFDYTNGDIDYQFKRQYFGPVDIMKVRIRILDEFGRVVDLNNSDYSFTIKVDQIYDSGAN